LILKELKAYGMTQEEINRIFRRPIVNVNDQLVDESPNKKLRYWALLFLFLYFWDQVLLCLVKTYHTFFQIVTFQF
jgi:hypothetical protein